MDTHIVGLVGPLGSGKTTIADHLLSQGYKSLRFSSVIDKEIESRGLEKSRKNQQDIGDELRTKFGADYISKLLIKEIEKSKNKKFVLDGFRNPSEVAPFRQLEGFVLIALNADPKVRFERLLERGQDRDPKDWESFQKQERRDQGIGQPDHGQNILRSLELADFVVDTDRPLNQVYNKVIEIIKEAQNESSRKIDSGSEDCDGC